MAKIRSNKWWKKLSYEEQEAYLSEHPSTKFKLTAVKIKDDTPQNILGEGPVEKLPPAEEVEKVEATEKELEEAEETVKEKIDIVLPDSGKILDSLDKEELEELEQEFKETVTNKGNLLKPISKLVLKVGIIGVSLVITGSITPTYLFLPSIYKDILDSSEEWSEKGSDFVEGAVNFIRKSLKTKGSKKFMKNSLLKHRKGS